MSGTTVPLGFPYPTDGDLVAQTDEAIQALAEAVDDSLAGTSVAVAAGANVTIPAGMQVHRRGRLCVLTMSGWTLSAIKGAGSQLAVIPVGYRPSVEVHFIVYNHVGVSFNFGAVEPNGDVLMGNAQGSGSALYATVTFPL